MTTHVDLEPAARRLARLVEAVPDDAPLFDRILGIAGRDPDWQPPHQEDLR
jgi:hypothetical protein